MKPKAFLSYRHNLLPEVAGKEILAKIIDEQQKLELVFDKSVTVIGDSVVAFMKELIAARCVFLFISEDYFKSAYTLFELIAVSEYGASTGDSTTDQKIILPICLTERMLDVKDYTAIKAHWNTDVKTRDVLATLLRTSGRSDGVTPDSDAMWRRIEQAWNDIVFGYLNTLRDMEAPHDVNVLINQVVEEANQAAVKATEETYASHKALLVEEVTYLLEERPLIRKQLTKSARYLREQQKLDDEAFSEHLLSDTIEVAKLLGELTGAAAKIRDSLGRNSPEWREVFQDIQQLSGCLLLNTIDPIWWFNHELELKRQSQECVTGSGYILDHPAFVEVVISKELLSSAELHSPKFKHDPRGKEVVVPGRGDADGDYNNMMMFDAVSVDAMAQTLLGQIHQDLHPSSSAPADKIELIREISDRAEAYKNVSNQRPVYYIVSHKYLQQLTSAEWFPDFEKALKGNLQFICCNQDTLSNAGSATKESQTLLLSTIGLLLDLNKD